MDLYSLREFFQWCVIINAIILIISAIFIPYAPKFVYRLNKKWFKVGKETFNVIVYGYLAIFKLFFIFFNVVPYIVMLVMTS